MIVPIAFGPVGYIPSQREFLQWHNWVSHIRGDDVWIDIPRSMESQWSEREDPILQVQTSLE